MPTFQQALQSEVLVFDGAMGTEIYRHHVFTNRSFDELCLSDPKLIQEIYRQYCDAGADVLTTNTFGANRPALAKYGLAEKAGDINRAGARLAREVADAAGRTVFVAGSIGPLSSQPTQPDALAALIVEQAEALLEGGADFIIFETQPSRDALQRCATAMRQLAEVPFVLSFAVMGQCETASGESIERMLAPLARRPARPCGLGNELRQRAGRAVERRRGGGARVRGAFDCAAQRGHAQGSGKPPHLFLLAGVSGRLCHALRPAGRVGGRRLLRHHPGAYSPTRPGRQAAGSHAAEAGGGGGRRRRRRKSRPRWPGNRNWPPGWLRGNG